MAREIIYPTNKACVHTRKGRKFETFCDLGERPQKERDVILEAPNNFDQYWKWTVIGALRLTFDFKYCERETARVLIYLRSSKNIHLQKPMFNQCAITISLKNSEASEISFPAQSIRILQNSIVEKIVVENVNDFKLEDSEVGEINITATKDNCTINNTNIRDVKSMRLLGNFNFEFMGSNISIIQGFHYSSSSSSSRSNMTDVKVKQVLRGGFIVSKGEITLERVTFEALDSDAILIQDGARVVIRDSLIMHALPDSWVIESGSTEFDNVTVGSTANYSSKYTGTSLHPMALLVECPTLPVTLLVSVLAILTLLAGILMGGVMVYFCMYRKTGHFERKQAEREGMVKFSNNEVATQPSSPLQPSPPTLTPGIGSLHPPQNGSLEDSDELYDDLQNAVPATMQSPGNFPGDRRFAPPQPPKTPVPQTSNQDPDEDDYDDICSVNAKPPLPPPFSAEKPADSAPALPLNPPPPIPQSSPAFGGFPSPQVTSPLPCTRNPPLPGDRGLLHDKGDTNSRPPLPIPNPPFKFSAQSSSSVPDERNKLPPPPPPGNDDDDDNVDIYDDTSSILPSPPPVPSPSFPAPPHAQPVPPGNNPSFLHGTPPAKPDPPMNSCGARPLATVKGKWRPNKPNFPVAPRPPPPPPPRNNDNDDDIYDDIQMQGKKF